MEEKQISTSCTNLDVVLCMKDSGDCVPFSAWSDVLNHIRRQELLASGFTEEQVGLDGKLYGVNEVEHKNDWRRII